MSGRRRRHRRELTDHVAVEHEFYESPSGNMEAWSTDEDSFYPPMFPGTIREEVFTDADNYRMQFPTLNDDFRDHVDWAVGGIPGETKNVGSTGVVTPYGVDAHDFRGEMAVIRRYAPSMEGPTGGTDHNGLLSLLYAMQESSAYFPNDVSQVDVIKAV